MDSKVKRKTEFDFDKFRLRNFVDRLIELDEVEIHDEQVALRDMSAMIEATDKAVLFRKAGPEQSEVIAKSNGGRKRIAAAFETEPGNVPEAYAARVSSPRKAIEISTDEAPVHQVKLTGDDVDLTRLPFHPQHAFDGSCYMSCGIDFVIDPATGTVNVGSRRLSLRNRTQTGTNITAPSDLKRIYQACVAMDEKLPISFAAGSHPLDFLAASTRQPGDQMDLMATYRGADMPMVKSLTNDIMVPADVEMVIEGYLDERGYVEPEGPFGEYMGYYGAIHMDPVFTCTAITMRRDVLHQTLMHGSAFHLHQTDGGNLNTTHTEAAVWKILKQTVREPVGVHMLPTAGGSNGLRISLRQRTPGEARAAIAALFGGIMRLKHIWVYDEDIDISDDRQVDWAMGTRFQADEDLEIYTGLMGMPMDPSLKGRRLGAKVGFDCTRELGRDGQITATRCAARTFDGPARFQTVEQALVAGPLYYPDLVEAIGSDDGREVACALDDLRQAGRLGRDRDGRYHLAEAEKGMTGIVGELYHDPNDGT